MCIRDRYSAAARESEKRGHPLSDFIANDELREMQSDLYSIIVALEMSKNPMESTQRTEAAMLYNAVSSVMNGG